MLAGSRSGLGSRKCREWGWFARARAEPPEYSRQLTASLERARHELTLGAPNSLAAAHLPGWIAPSPDADEASIAWMLLDALTHVVEQNCSPLTNATALVDLAIELENLAMLANHSDRELAQMIAELAAQ